MYVNILIRCIFIKQGVHFKIVLLQASHATYIFFQTRFVNKILWNSNIILNLVEVTSCLWPLRKKCPYSELFWSTLSLIRIEYGEFLQKQMKRK